MFTKRSFGVTKILRNYTTTTNKYLEYTKKKPKLTQKMKNFITILQHNYSNKNVQDIALNTLKDNPGSKTKAKRLGRGEGSGKGRTAGRGNMGQHSRPSSNLPPGFQGGQSRLYRRVPKYGFSNKKFELCYEPISLEKIQYFIDTGRISKEGTITLRTLYDAGCITKLKYPGIKITSVGSEHFKAKIDVETTRISAKAVQKIEENGGSVRSIYFSKRALLALKRQKTYNAEEMMKIMSMPPPKLFRYYMKPEIRGYLCDTNPIHPLRDVVPPEESQKEREKGMVRLFNYKKAQTKDTSSKKKAKK